MAPTLPSARESRGAPSAERLRVVIAGAGSPVGQALAARLSASHDVVALGRPPGGQAVAAGVEWRACDLFNLLEAERALAGAKVAVYLVRSVRAPASFTQGSAADLALTCADNFGRAARSSGVRHIVYLGDLLPPPGDAPSQQRARQLEVERALGAHAVPLVTLRAGRLGAGGWLLQGRRLRGRGRRRAQSIALEDLVQRLVLAVEGRDLAAHAESLAGPEETSSAELLHTAAAAPEEPALDPPRSGRIRSACSVQRLPVGPGGDAAAVAREYLRWLSRLVPPLLRISVDEERGCRFALWPLRRPILELTYSAERSSPDRQLFYVTGGLLAGKPSGARPRLEFRTVLSGAYVLASLHDFVPRLPWFVYRNTQALVHLVVMRAFARHLASETS